jgi:hypothetical protein
MSNTVAPRFAGTDFEEVDFFLHADLLKAKNGLENHQEARRMAPLCAP